MKNCPFDKKQSKMNKIIYNKKYIIKKCNKNIKWIRNNNIEF